MAKTPKLSDLQMPGHSNTTSDIVPSKDMHHVRDEHNIEMSRRKREITDKINALNKKLQKHELKEGMLDKIISMTYVELENIKENEFTRRGQKQSILIKQMEALSILHDTLIKYEDMIQKYHKILIDIENNKLNSFLKIENLKKEEKATDENIADLLMMVQDQMGAGTSTGINPLLDEIKSELEENNY
jgi:hypothetical protein